MLNLYRKGARSGIRQFASKAPDGKINPFENDSFVGLLKKSIVYRLSQSDLLLNNGESLIKTSNKIFGKGFTNTIVEKTGGAVFTSGPTLQTLTKDADYFWRKHHVESVGNYVMEGIESDRPDLFNKA